MGAPLSMPSDAVPVSSVWRAISGMGFFRRLLGIASEQPALASGARERSRLGLETSDGEAPDTSLTQAELEVLK
jgi:hypothetical protein